MKPLLVLISVFVIALVVPGTFANFVHRLDLSICYQALKKQGWLFILFTEYYCLVF